jgi:hypothetical protein
MSKINKRFRNAKGQFISKKESGYITREALKNEIDEKDIFDYIRNLTPDQVKEQAKKGNPSTGKLKSRWRNKAGQLISYKKIESIKSYFDELIPPQQKEGLNYRNEVKKWDLDVLDQFADAGRKVMQMVAIQYLSDSGYDDNTEMKVEQRLSQAQAEKSTPLYINEKKTFAELLAIIKEDSEEYKAYQIKNGENWYKTYIYLSYDPQNNTITYDPNVDDLDGVQAPPIESEASKKLRGEQINWQKRWEQKQKNKK